MSQVTVADLTVEELKTLIREVVLQTFWEMLGDPDEDLVVDEAFQVEIQRSLAALQAGAKTTPIEQVAEELGLKW